MGDMARNPNDWNYVDATPRADALIAGLRDFGYSLETALADVIDNSLSASATRINVLADFNDGDPSISISDDGVGMNEGTLHEVMRPGGRRAWTANPDSDLGRFGLGMKTAAFSQAKILTVTSYVHHKKSSARWDLEHVERTNKWQLMIPPDSELREQALQPREHGTVVVWECLDRLVEGANKDAQRRDFNKKLVSAITHLELVLHRFLQGDQKNKAVQITFNGKPLIPNDPFLLNNIATIKSPVEKLQFQGESIEIQAYTLPHHSKMTAVDWQQSGGARGHTATQGFYLYRARRLIVHGTWFGMLRKSPTSQLTRIRIDIPTTLDNDWKVNVLKASASPPLLVKDRLAGLVPSLVNVANKVYAKRGTVLPDSHKTPLWLREAVHGGIQYSINIKNPYLEDLLRSASEAERKRIEKLIHVIEAGLPLDSLFLDLANNPRETHTTDLDLGTLKELVQNVLDANRAAGVPIEDTLRVLEVSEPYKSQWDQVAAIVNSIGDQGEQT